MQSTNASGTYWTKYIHVFRSPSVLRTSKYVPTHSEKEFRTPINSAQAAIVRRRSTAAIGISLLRQSVFGVTELMLDGHEKFHASHNRRW